MKVLIVKMSSMGDILHTLPAVNDAAAQIPNLTIDWVVEEAFAEIPQWHPAVRRVIPIALRRWRKQPIKAIRKGQWQSFYRHLRQENYDLVIDAQGLTKSAFITALSRGLKVGYAKTSAREPLAAVAYQKKYPISKKQHAIEKVRELFAAALNYSKVGPVNYGLQMETSTSRLKEPYVLLLHGTTWESKHWPESYWCELITLLEIQKIHCYLPWHSEAEMKRAYRLSRSSSNNNSTTTVLPKQSLGEIAHVIHNATACVSVDSGLSHLSAALGTPTVGIYGPTDPKLSGALGKHVELLNADFPCAPCLQELCKYQGSSKEMPACFETVTPQHVMDTLLEWLPRS